MAWQDAKTIAETWVVEHLPMDLRGQILQLVNFEDDKQSRFFYPDRTAEFHKMVTSAIARTARKRGARTNYATITPEHYREWCTVQSVQDSDVMRLRFIESMHVLMR